MKKINFLTKHVISKIESLIIDKQNYLNHKGFLYFDKPQKVKKGILNRVNKYNFYYQNEILPNSFYQLRGTDLVEVFNKLKKNQFYIYKDIKGKDYKTRIKQ